jgi:GWxTD domain-containing protein
MRPVILSWLLLSAVSFAQVEYSAGSDLPGKIFFFTDMMQVKSGIAGKTQLDIFVQVPYSSMLFTKKDKGFSTSYNVNLFCLDDKKENTLDEINFPEKITVNDFAQTTSKDNFNLSNKSFTLSPGSYIIKCIVEDNDSHKSATKETPVLIRQFSDSLSISDIMPVLEIIKDSTGEKIIPNISNTIENKISSLPFFVTVFSDKNRNILLEYILTDSRNNMQLTINDPRLVRPGANFILKSFNFSKISLGDYTIKVSLKDKSNNEITSVEKKIHSKIFGMPSSITDLDKAIDQMLYIATPMELDSIRAGKTYDEKLKRFQTFWWKKKPNKTIEDNPIVLEYYRRIEYANKHFKGFSEGWRSDMGLIYITLGPPNNVQREIMASNSKPYEVWEYYELERTFVFIDQTGFGEYYLVDPDYSSWPGYRN